jgi:GT2 family glycosyltransferase
LKSPYHVIYNSKQRGFAKNNNLAASRAKSEYLCLLNNDVFVDGDWLQPMIKVFEDNQNVGVVGNVQRLAFSKKYDHMGVVFDPSSNPRHYGQGFFHRPYKGEVRKWSAVTAACCIVRRKKFLESGGFNEIYINGCEDIDFCLRLGKEGLSHFVVHDSVVSHVRCASEGRLKFNKENESKLLAKWKKEIVTNYISKDRSKYAKWFIIKSLFKPFSVNCRNLVIALKIFFQKENN